MSKKNSSITLPSNPKDREKLKTMLTEMVKCMRRRADEGESLKEIGKEVKVLFNLAPKHVNKLAKTMYKQNFPEIQSENQEFEELYETVVEGKKEVDGE